jgi:diguanylate cyclase (GGDEF)-like protein
VGGDHGLLVRRAGSQRFEPVPGLEGDGQVGLFPPVWTIFEDHEGRLWVGTDKAGMGLLNRAANRIEGVPGLAGADSLIGKATVRGVVEVHKNRFWIATYGSGLITFDSDTMRGHRYVRDLTSSAPLSNNFMRSIFMDRTGLVWLGTDRGLSKVNSSADGLLTIHSSPLRKNGLIGNEVRSVSAQGDRLWVGFDQGGFAVIEPDGRIRNVAPAPGLKPEDRSQREVLAIKAADERTVFAGGQGLYEIDAARLTYRPVPEPLLKGQVVNALLIDGDDVWAATYNGLVRYNRKAKKALLFSHSVTDPNSLSDNYVRDLVKSQDGKLWITTRLGLDWLDPATGKFEHVRHEARRSDSLPNDNIQPLTEDLKGRLWIGTIGDGITVQTKADPDGRAHFRTLRHADGFPNDIVLTVMRGTDGRIWSNTPGGLAVIDPDTFKVRSYTAADGLRTSSQNLFSSATLRDGTIVFPGDQGLIVVRPDLLTQRTPAASLVATYIQMPDDPNSAISNAWRSQQHGIVLPPEHRAFEATFALLDYNAPDSVSYSYRLEGFDKGWSRPSPDRRTVAYTNLPAGHYRLQIRAVDRNGAGPAVQMEMAVVAQALWTETWWFYLLACLGIAGFVVLAVRLRTAMIRKRKEELEREVALRTEELARKQDELVLANLRLADLATRDPLTGIYNRRHFMAEAENERQRTLRTGSPFTLLLIDADHFKSINDRYGHIAGDEVLKSVARQISDQLRGNDIVARYGGEELVVLLVDTGLQEGALLAERLRADVADTVVTFLGNEIRVTISVGVAQYAGSEIVDEVLARSDAALYAAKSGGRNKVICAEARDSSGGVRR